MFHSPLVSKFLVTSLLCQVRCASSNVVPFQKEHHSDVERIAIANLSKLVSVPCSNGEPKKKELFEAGVRPLLHEKSCLVLLKNDRAVAFLTHSEPTRMFFRTWVKIEHLATDSTFRNEGHGSTLLRHALVKFNAEGVQFTEVELTDLSLKKYYGRFGFKSQLTIQTKTNTYAKLVLKLGDRAHSFREQAMDHIVMRQPKIRFLVYYALYLLPIFMFLKRDHNGKKEPAC